MKASQGQVIITPEVDIWPHELRTATALAVAGYTVEFVRKSNVSHERSADVLIDGTVWEMKAPKSSKLKKVERTLRDALHQSPYVVYDSSRVKDLCDAQIKIALEKWASELKSLRGLIFVAKNHTVTTIK